jgi:hypothetical protein
LKRIFTNPYVIAGIIVFLLLFVIGIVWLDVSWTEALFGSAALSVIGVGSFWWKEKVW